MKRNQFMNIERALSVLPIFIAECELRWLAQQAEKHDKIVEIGSYMGRSTLALACNTS